MNFSFDRRGLSVPQNAAFAGGARGVRGSVADEKSIAITFAGLGKEIEKLVDYDVTFRRALARGSKLKL